MKLKTFLFTLCFLLIATLGWAGWGKLPWGQYKWGKAQCGPWGEGCVSPFDAQPTAGQTLTLNLSLPADKWMEIDWGDGSTRTMVVGPVTQQDFSHTYSDAGTYPIRFYGDYEELTRLKHQPYLVEITGDIQRLSKLTSVTYFYSNDNTLTGDIKWFPRSMDHIEVYGSNTVSGNVKNLPPNITFCRIYGSNTVEGSILDLPRTLTAVRIAGYNTITGSLADLPPNLTDVIFAGKNTIYGDLANLPNGINYYCWFTGNNTISDYSGKTWTNKPSNFQVVPVSPGGLSTSEVDQLLIDLDADLTWSSGDVITLTGANAPRSSASDAAVNNLIAEGVTVTTN